MRVFVSGATGVVGRRLLPILASQGYSVTALARSPESRSRLERTGVKAEIADLFHIESLKRGMTGCDAVINVATHIPSSALKMVLRSAWRENDRIRSEGVANLVEAALHCGVARFVQESFALAYPDRGDEWIDETTPLEPSAYSRTVLDAEHSVARFRDGGGVGVVLRYAAFYGPDATQVRFFVDGLRRGWVALPGRPDAYISSISHHDAASAAASALNAPSGVYNAGDDEPVLRSVYFSVLAGELGLRAPHFLPRWTKPLFGSTGDVMSRSVRLANGKFKDATGWTPLLRSVREGWPVVVEQMKAVDAFRETHRLGS